MAETKKHHWVSALLLRKFADAREFVDVLPVDGSSPRSSSVLNVGIRNKAHTVAFVDADNPAVFEDHHAALESRAANVIAKLIERQRVPTGSDREILEQFMLLHMFRHPGMMAHAAGFDDSSLAQHHDHPNYQEIRGDMLVEAISWPALIHVAEYDTAGSRERWAMFRKAFSEFRWHVVSYDRDSLVIGDTLVCTSRVDRQPNGSGEREFGGGMESADRITVPLSPRVGLLLARDPALTSVSAIGFNRTTVGSARKFVAYAPDWPAASPVLHRVVLEDVNRASSYFANRDSGTTG